MTPKGSGSRLRQARGIRSLCPHCGSEYLGVGTVTHNDDGSHGFSPDTRIVDVQNALGRRLSRTEWDLLRPLLAERP